MQGPEPTEQGADQQVDGAAYAVAGCGVGEAGGHAERPPLSPLQSQDTAAR